MKLAWFSPLMPAQSEIANVTERLRGPLEERFATRFLTENGDGFFEPATGAVYSSGLGLCPYDLLVSLNAGNIPVYNLGNNPTFFAHTWFLSQFKPGIVILHDVKLHHFFEGIYRAQLCDDQRYVDLLARHYGARGREAGAAYCQSKLSINFMAEHFPMTTWAVENALAVVVHTDYAYQQVRKATTTPVWVTPLPHDAPVSRLPVTSAKQRRNERVDFSPQRPAKLVIFGYLNVNRRIIEFLHALATMPERECFEVHILGTVFHRVAVEAAVNLLDFADRVTLHGYVPDARLEEVLDDADLAINLRYPTMGEASGSQLRIWDHALPSLVTFTEGYKSLPPQCVSFVRPEHERTDIQQHLRLFLRHPRRYQEKGQHARRWLLEHHQPVTYVDAIKAICENAGALRSRQTRLRLAERVGKAMTPWAPSGTSGERVGFYAARIAEIA